MTAAEWHALADDCRSAGAGLIVDPDGYAELVRLRLAHDPLDMADHSTHLDGVPLILDLTPNL